MYKLAPLTIRDLGSLPPVVFRERLLVPSGLESLSRFVRDGVCFCYNTDVSILRPRIVRHLANLSRIHHAAFFVVAARKLDVQNRAKKRQGLADKGAAEGDEKQLCREASRGEA